MKCLSITQTAERLSLSRCRIWVLCGDGRVPGAILISSILGIQEDAVDSADAMVENGKYIKKKIHNASL